MGLGSSREEIAQKFWDLVMLADRLKLLQEKTNQLYILMNNCKVTIRAQIEGGQLIKVNGFIGKTNRGLQRPRNLIRAKLIVINFKML